MVLVVENNKEVVKDTFEIKHEVEQLEVEEVQNRAKLNGIPKLVHEYIVKYSKYVCYCWVPQSLVLQMATSFESNMGHKFPSFPPHCNLKNTPTTCTSTINLNLYQKDFANF